MEDDITFVLKIAVGILLGYILVEQYKKDSKLILVLALTMVLINVGFSYIEEVKSFTSSAVFATVMIVGAVILVIGVFAGLGIALEHIPYLKKFSSKDLKKFSEYSGNYKEYVYDRIPNGFILFIILLPVMFIVMYIFDLKFS